jgi:hypothetical protein
VTKDRRPLLLAGLLYPAVAVALTWPLALHPASMVVGGARSDTWNSVWGLWFVLQQGAPWPPAHTLLLDHPSGGVLAVADPLNALLGLPLAAIWGPVLAYAVLVLFHLSLAGWAGHALGRVMGGRGWLSGLAWQMAPVAVAQLHNGSSEAMASGWLPLACLAAVRAQDAAPGVGRTLLLALALSTCTLGGWYAGVDGWLVCLALLAVAALQGELPRRARQLLPGMMLALALTAPIAQQTRAVAEAEDGLVDIKGSEDLARIRRTLGAADPRVLVTPGAFRSPDFARLEGNPSDFVHTAYLGWLLLGLAGFGLLRRHDGTAAALALAGGTGVVLALGPVVVWGGFPLSLAGRALPLPYLLLEGLPGFGSLSLVYRLAGIGSLALAVLADRALVLLPARIAALAIALVLVELRLVSPVAGLPAVTPVPVFTALQTVRAGADAGLGGAVLNLPPTASRAYLYEQTLHGQPLVGSVNAGVNVGGLQVLTTARGIREGRTTADDLIRMARKHEIRWVVQHKDVLMEQNVLIATAELRAVGTLVAEDEHVRVLQLY